MNFRSYLNKYLSSTSISEYLKSVDLYKKWLEKEHLSLEEIRHKEILSYINHCEENGNKKRTINYKLNAIKYWYQYHGITLNPCDQIYVRGIKRTIPKNLLTDIELKTIYDGYPENSPARIRDKVMLGLLCYQGMTMGEIIRLDDMDIQVEVGYIRIRPTKKSNGRTIKLEEVQRPILTRYEEVREELLSQSGLETTLYIVNGGLGNLKGTADELIRSLRKRYPAFKSTYQLRASVIRNWLKRYNMREVQYMIGHRYISSTERYCEDYLEDLQKKLDEYHPLNESK